MKTKFLLKVLFSICLVLVAATQVQAAGITISPPKFEFSVDPGKSVQGTVKLINNDAEDLILESDVQDFIAGNETGQPQFINPEENDSSISLGRWVEISTGAIVVPANGELEIGFKITIPQSAEPGGHYGSIFFSPPISEGQVAVVQKIGSLVLVRVSGEVKETGHLETFGSYVIQNKDNFEGAEEKGFYEYAPVSLAVRYQNEGNIHLKPSGKIEIFNTFGKQLEKIGVENVLNENGLVTAQNIVDYLPVNDLKGNVLAKSTRMFLIDYQGQAYWFQNEDGTKEIKHKGFPVGRYKAKLTLTGAAGATETQEVNFIIFPWKQIFGYGFGSIILLTLIVKINRRRRKSLREKLRAELAREMQKNK